jgi:raffinose/stachyose/melibiose transport system permease protein
MPGRSAEMGSRASGTVSRASSTGSRGSGTVARAEAAGRASGAVSRGAATASRAAAVGQGAAAGVLGRTVAYVVFTTWALITVLPLIWMLYSSFKSNDELIRSTFSLPHDLFDNREDEFRVIPPALNVILPYDPEVDKRERLIIESATISPGRRLMVQFLLKEKLPPELRELKPGDTLRLSQLPPALRLKVSLATVFFNYIAAITRGTLVLKFLNSIIYTGVSTFLIAFLALMISFALSKLPFRRLSVIVLGLIGLGYLLSIQSVIIPVFLMLTRARLTDTHQGIILVYTAFGLPLAVLLMTQFMRGLPDSLIESAYIDGASVFRTFLSIMVPMSTPVIVTVSIISALGIWNEFLLVLVFASSEATKSLPVGVYSFTSLMGTQLGWQLAALVIATVPVMAVYLAFNKSLTRGVVAGALKE